MMEQAVRIDSVYELNPNFAAPFKATLYPDSLKMQKTCRSGPILNQVVKYALILCKSLKTQETRKYPRTCA
jgi:hypothetical protein